MKKILGIDLGIGSIGASMVGYDAENRDGKILFTTVRRVPLDTNTINEFTSGKSVTMNVTRQQSRTQRRNNFRKHLRRDTLIEILTRIGFIEPETDLRSDDKMILWESRAKAPYEQVSKSDLARIFLLLLNRRGFRPTKEERVPQEEKEGSYKGNIEANHKALKENEQFVGEYLYNQLLDNPHFRIKDRIFKRWDYIREFDAIWEQQAKFYPELTKSLKKEVGDRCIFYQRDLKSKKHLVSKCRFETQRKVSPKSSPVFQEFRIWSDLNHLVITDIAGRTVPISLEDKKKLYQLLARKQKLTANQILKELGLNNREYNLNVDSVTGNKIRIEIGKALLKEGQEARKYLDVDFSQKGDSFFQQPAILLWHILYSLPLEDIPTALESNFDLLPETVEALSEITLPQGYGSVCSKAIRKILPGLWEGMTYDKACEAAGYQHSDYLTREENEKRELADEIDPIGRNQLRNPVAEKVLNQLITLVNAILSDPDLGRPDIIRIEMARDLKRSSKERDKISKSIKKREKYYKEVEKKLIAWGAKPTRKNKIKYLLGEIQDWIDPYTLKAIQPSKVFGSDHRSYDVDHIIPQSLFFDDSISNKVLTSYRENKAKDQQTAIDYMQSKGEKAFEDYCRYVNDTDLGYRKQKYLLMSRSEIPQDFLNRDLATTRYITKEALSRLAEVCRNVEVSTGRVTDFLRRIWGLDELLREINIPTYGKHGLVSEKNGKLRIENWSKRNDHRNHALDALVVALTDRSIIQRLNTLAGEEKELAESWKKIPVPWKTLRRDTANAIRKILVTAPVRNRVGTRNTNRIKVSKMTDPKGYVEQTCLTPRGAFHIASKYGMNWSPQWIEVSQFKKWTVDQIRETPFVDQVHKQALLNHIQSHDNDFRKAFLKKALPIKVGKREINQMKVLLPQYVIRKKVDQFLNVSQVVDQKVRKVLEERLTEFGNDKKKAFSDLENNPIFLSRERGIVIKKVKVKYDGKNLIPLKEKDSPSKKRKHQKEKHVFVDPKNNHHISFFRKPDGKLTNLPAVSFWDAFERQKQGLPVILQEHPEGHEFLFHLEKGDYFLFAEPGFVFDELNDQDQSEYLSENLYRVKSISSDKEGGIDTEFEHHFISLRGKQKGLNHQRVASLGRLSGGKVSLSAIGEIKAITWTNE